MIYVAGGIYGAEFIIIRPSGKGDLPYATSNPTGSLWRSIKANSHMYRVEPDGWLFLELVSFDAESKGVAAPLTHKLSPEKLDEVEKSFERFDHK